jgi:hypothetical protein
VVSSFLYSCEKDEKDPSVSVITAEAVSASSAKAVGFINQSGDYKITDHGFVYAISNSNYPDEQINTSNKISLGNVIKSDTFTAILPLTSYYQNYYGNEYKWRVWAYITNEKGTVYSTKSASFSPMQLSLRSIYPTVGKTGDTITIYGDNFDPSVSLNNVQFSNNTSINAQVISASKTQLKVIVPYLSSTNSYYDENYDIVLTIGNQNVTLNNVFFLLPTLTGFSPKKGTFGTNITIQGSNLSNISAVIFGNKTNSFYGSGNSITVQVPNTVDKKKFKLYVLKGGMQFEVPGGEFEMLSPTISSISPATVRAGENITITGTNFNSYSYNKVFIGQTEITSSYSSSGYTSISVYAPSNFAPGDYKVRMSNGIDTVEAPGTLKVVVPSITGISPTSGYSGTTLTVSGHNFTNDYYVYFNGSGYYATSHDSVSYKIKVPALEPGTYKIKVNSGSSYIQSPTDFMVIAPTLTSLTPTSGSTGTSIVINGQGFGTNAGNVTVRFGNLNAPILIVSDTQINIKVPAGAGAGTWSVSVTVNGYTIANTLSFQLI